MAKSDSLLIEPPTIARTRQGSADQALTARMQAEVGEGKWVTDGKTYKDYKGAGNESQVYRRSLASALSVEPHKIKSRVWGVKDGAIVTDRNKPADWRFALTVDPNRAKQVRTRKAR